MKRLVLDASVVLGWFTHGQGGSRALRAEYESGGLMVVVPGVLFLEVLDAVARATGWPQDRLTHIAHELGALGFEVREPSAPELALWIGRGLSGSEAAYAALASGLGLPLATEDDRLQRIASAVTQH